MYKEIKTMSIKEQIDDYFNGIVHIKISSKEQMYHDKLMKKVRHNRICLIYQEAKRIKRIINE